jgi:hypothetical protein
MGEKVNHDDRIVVTPDGLALTTGAVGAVRWCFRWEDVARIVAWKEDLFSFDRICLGFCLLDETDYLCCNEHQAGWAELCEELERRFHPQADWQSVIPFPPFQENLTVLWRSQLRF